ncbi:MAG: DISARM system SNF2-like helicase DrmD [Hyphomicrobium sp.]
MSAPQQAPPRVGMLATVRNRRGLVTAVEPSGGGRDETVHLVSVEYIDADGAPEDQLLWETEQQLGATILEPSALPAIASDAPMAPAELDALVRATRWSALTPYVDPDGRDGPLDRLPLASPLHGAIQVEDFQLVPLLKAMRMPRVSLLLADDVGLGKTIEAGLILTELILRRRVRRILIVCPASLRTQWRQEMREKFALDFEVVDRPATHALQRRLGLDANPWRTFPRAITSFDYLKQDDVLEQFRAASRINPGSPHLAWDLLVVDEAHNLSPSSLGDDSDASKMLRRVAPWFEHRLFLTATPHNGHTRSFTGLLECLDPVRFTRKSEPLTDSEKMRVEQVVVRRLKREINERTQPPRFGERDLVAVPLVLSPEEQALGAAFDAFRKRVRGLVAKRKRKEELAGAFAVEVLGKRLLSCPVAFADSWQRYRIGVEEPDGADDTALAAVDAARRQLLDETPDDREVEGRTGHAAHVVGAWLRPLADELAAEMCALDAALDALGLADPASTPRRDARFDTLVTWIDTHLRAGRKGFVADERLVIFTEYKTTLDYLERRLRERYPDPGAVQVLFGGMDDRERDSIKTAFNDPADPVRVLIATDAASEGLNLQETARFLFHYDIPWNPARLEQRNGRLDRHGQARDVTVHHFTSNEDADLRFLAKVAQKVNTIREDLGSTGDVFDRAVERRLIDGADADAVYDELEVTIERARGRAALPRARDIELGDAELRKLAALAKEIDLDPDALTSTLDVALGLGIGGSRLHGPDDDGRFQLVLPVPVAWQELVDDTVRLPATGGLGALRGLCFDPRRLMREVGPRQVFHPRRDTVLMHLGHPVYRRALNTFARSRFPGASVHGRATRWSVRQGAVPDGADALLLLTVEELAVNDLRETFHHWVRTVAIPIRRGELAAALPHAPARALRAAHAAAPTPQQVAAARELWEEIGRDVRDLVRAEAAALSQRLAAALERDRAEADAAERERFQQRQGEVSALIERSTVQRLQREIDDLKAERQQGVLFDRDARLRELEQSVEEREAEVRRRRQQYEELREQLQIERDRVLSGIIPRRFALRGGAQVFPVAIEIRLAERR